EGTAGSRAQAAGGQRGMTEREGRQEGCPKETAMKRRAIGLIVSLALCVAPLTADAQVPRKVPRIGYLATEQGSPFGGIDAFRQGLRELGYVEGQNIALTPR